MTVMRTARWIDDERFLRVIGDWGGRDLRIRAFSGTETLSQPFEFELELYSEDARIPFREVIGKRVSVGFRRGDGGERRWFNGFINRFTQLPGEGRVARYRAVMTPWLWFLSQASDCRIFQRQSVPEIVTTILREYGLADFEWRTEGTYEPWEYCVQYRETALNFISRLLEQEGITYYFEHTVERHTLVFADGMTHPVCQGQSRVRYEQVLGEGVHRDEDVVLAWRHEQNFQAGTYTLQDYNFEKPLHNLATEAPSVVPVADRRFEIYDFPGEYEGRSGGEDWVKIRMQEAEASHAAVFGEGFCRSFAPGHRFEITELEHAENGWYFLTSVTHQAREAMPFATAAGDAGTEYENQFTCLPVELQYRPPRLTPKPFVQGSQTATVVGPPGEEIHTDEFGQVKVHFHWDRRSRRNDRSSCWIRVSQPWAGQNWGAISIPRIGQEVIVDFLEGDPDRPIITGRVYNAQQKPPYDLPGDARKTGLRSRSSPGGGGYNEMMLDDTKGNEGVTIHAQYNMQTRVENDDLLSIGNNQTVEIGVNRTETVGADETITIGANRKESVGADETTSIGGNSSRTVGKNDTFAVGLTRTHTVGINEAVTVGAAQQVSVGGVRVVTVGVAQLSTAGVAQLIKAGVRISLAAPEIMLTAGASTIVMNDSGITINGPIVKINS